MFVTHECSNNLETVKCASDSSESDRQDLPWDSVIVSATPSSDSDYYEERQITTEISELATSACQSNHNCYGTPAVKIQDKCTTSVDLPPLSWHGYNCIPKFLSISNTGRSVLIKGQWSNGKPYIQGGPLNGSYIFSQIHFHCPSEHEIDGKRYPLEMHVVHYKTSYLTQERAMEEKDGTVVLVYFFQVMDTDDTILSWLTKQCPRIKAVNKPTEIAGVALNHIVKPFYSQYYIYWGSVSTKRHCYLLQWIINSTNLYATKQEVHDLFKLMESGDGNGGRHTNLMKPVNGAIYYAGGYSLTFRGLDEAANCCSNCYKNQANLISQCCQTHSGPQQTKKDAQFQVSLIGDGNDNSKLYFTRNHAAEGYENAGTTECTYGSEFMKEIDATKWTLEKVSDYSMEVAFEDSECQGSYNYDNCDFATPPSYPTTCMNNECPPCENQEQPKRKKLPHNLNLEKPGAKFFTSTGTRNNTHLIPSTLNTNVTKAVVSCSEENIEVDSKEKQNICKEKPKFERKSIFKKKKKDEQKDEKKDKQKKNEKKKDEEKKDEEKKDEEKKDEEKDEEKEEQKKDKKKKMKEQKKDEKVKESRRKSLLPRSKVKSKSRISECETKAPATSEEKNSNASPSPDCTVNFLFTPNIVKSIPSFPLMTSATDIKNAKASAFKVSEENSKAFASAYVLQQPKAKEPLTEFSIQTEHLFHTKNKENFSSCTSQDFNVAIIYKQNILQEFRGSFSPNKMKVGSCEKLELLPEYPEPDNITVQVEDCTVKMNKLDQLCVKAKFLLKQSDSNTVDVKPTVSESVRTIKVEPKKKLVKKEKSNKVKDEENNQLMSAAKLKNPKWNKNRKQTQSDQLVARNGKSEKKDLAIELLKGTRREIEATKSNILDSDQRRSKKLDKEKSLVFPKSDKTLRSAYRDRKKTLFFSYEKVEKDESSGKKVFVGKFRTESEIQALKKGKKLSENKPPETKPPESKPPENNEPTPATENSLGSKEDSFFSLPNREIILEETVKCENLEEQQARETKSPVKDKEQLKPDKENNAVILHYYNHENFAAKSLKNTPKSKSKPNTSQSNDTATALDPQNPQKPEKSNTGSLRIKVPKSSSGKDTQTPHLIIPLEMDSQKVKETSIEVILTEDGRTSRKKSKKRELSLLIIHYKRPEVILAL